MSNLWRSWWIFPCLDDELRHWHVDSASIPQCTLWIRARLVSSSSWSLLSACFLSSWENPFCFQFPNSCWELDNLLVRFFVFYWKLRMTWVRRFFFFMVSFVCLFVVSFLLGKIHSASNFPVPVESLTICLSDSLYFIESWEWPEWGSNCNSIYLRVARARIWLQFNLCENGQSEDLIVIQSICSTPFWGCVWKELCGCGVQSSRDWRTKWRGCKVQSRIKHWNSQTQELCLKQSALISSELL